MHLGRCHQRRRVGRKIGGQQGREQHAGLFGDRLDARPGVATQHHDELDLVLADQLGRPGASHRGIVLVVIADEFDLVAAVAELDAAFRVHRLRPDLAAVEAGLAPSGDRAGQRREKADLDDAIGGKRLRGQAAAHRASACEGGCRDHE